MFSPNVNNGSCTYECGKENQNNNCETKESDNYCKCFDDVGKLWIANETDVEVHDCSEYQPTLIGKNTRKKVVSNAQYY